MKPATEVKILKNILVIIEGPDAKERSCRRISIVQFTLGMLCLFYLFSDNLQNTESRYIVVGAAFVPCLCFGLGTWFNQMGFQTKLVTKHLSEKSINERINKLNA